MFSIYFAWWTIICCLPSQGKRDESTSVDAGKAKADAKVPFYSFKSCYFIGDSAASLQVSILVPIINVEQCRSFSVTQTRLAWFHSAVIRHLTDASLNMRSVKS